MTPNPVCRRASPLFAGRTTKRRSRFYVVRTIKPRRWRRSCERWKASCRIDSIELIVDPRHHGVNRKVSNLINIMPRVRHDTLVLSDSDIVVDPDYLRALTALLAAPGVGAVTCLYHGIGGTGLWTRLSALAINATFLPHAITAVSLGLAKPCCRRDHRDLRRSMLDRIGGFSALRRRACRRSRHRRCAFARQGYDVVTAPFLVGHCCFEGSLRELIRQQMRCRAHDQEHRSIGYAGTIITHPWPLALLALLSGSPAAVMVTAAVLLARALRCAAASSGGSTCRGKATGSYRCRI